MRGELICCDKYKCSAVVSGKSWSAVKRADSALQRRIDNEKVIHRRGVSQNPAQQGSSPAAPAAVCCAHTHGKCSGRNESSEVLAVTAVRVRPHDTGFNIPAPAMAQLDTAPCSGLPCQHGSPIFTTQTAKRMRPRNPARTE